MHPIVSEMIVTARRADLERNLSGRSTRGLPVRAPDRRPVARARRWSAGRLRALAQRVDVTTRLDHEAHPVGQ